jgi:catechol 2,3-dioxygenase-like lactoylglutathione lyase family enzyme
MSVPARVTVLTLGVRDLAKTTAFYRALGWRLSSASVEGEVSFFHTGGCALALFGQWALAEDAGLEDEPISGFRAVATAVNVGSDAEVDAALGAAVEAGAGMVRSAEPKWWGGYVGYFTDPEGNLWEVTHNPHWQLDEQGAVILPD